MQEKKVLCIWDVRPELRQYLREHLRRTPAEPVFPENIEEENLISLARDADAIIGWRPSKRLLLAAENIKLFINPGVGVQHIRDLFLELESEGKPIKLANGHGNTHYTAEGAVALLLAYMNKIVPHHNWMAEGKWRFLDEKEKSVPLILIPLGLLALGSTHFSIIINSPPLQAGFLACRCPRMLITSALRLLAYWNPALAGRACRY